VLAAEFFGVHEIAPCAFFALAHSHLQLRADSRRETLLRCVLSCAAATKGFSCSMADVVIRNGQVVVGNGEPSFIGDVAIKDGKVAAVGPSLDVVGAEEVDATGLVSLLR
jgi:adenine deaminase